MKNKLTHTVFATLVLLNVLWASYNIFFRDISAFTIVFIILLNGIIVPLLIIYFWKRTYENMKYINALNTLNTLDKELDKIRES